MKSLLSKPWFLAVLALLLMLGTQFAALKLSWKELFPDPAKIAVIHPAEPAPLHWGFAAEEIMQLKTELENRLKKVDERAANLNAFEARLLADRSEIDAIKAEVQKMRDSLLNDVIKLEQSEEKNLKNLAKTYSEIDATAAVSIFEELDVSTVVKIMYFMKTDIQAEILGVMATRDPGNKDLVRKAAKLSDMLRLFSSKSEQDPGNT